MSNDFYREEIERILDAKEHLRQKFRERSYFWLPSAPLDKMFVSGGAIASLLQGERPNDYDVYCKDYNSILTFSKVLQKDHKNSIADVNEKYREFFGKDGKMITESAITMDNKISFITMLAGSPEFVRNTFDYIHCLPYYDIAENKLYISREQYDACVNKVLVVNNAANVKPYRENKFFKRGYIKC